MSAAPAVTAAPASTPTASRVLPRARPFARAAAAPPRWRRRPTTQASISCGRKQKNATSPGRERSRAARSSRVELVRGNVNCFLCAAHKTRTELRDGSRMTQYAVCYTLENPPPGAELVCFNRLTGGDTPARRRKDKGSCCRRREGPRRQGRSSACGARAGAGTASAPAPAPAAGYNGARGGAEAMAKWSVMSNWAQNGFSESGLQPRYLRRALLRGRLHAQPRCDAAAGDVQGPEGATEWFADKDDWTLARRRTR